MKHPGFAKAAASISAKEGVDPARARAILAAGARKASLKARRRNPKLMKVSGVKRPSLRQVAGK